MSKQDVQALAAAVLTIEVLVACANARSLPSKAGQVESAWAQDDVCGRSAWRMSGAAEGRMLALPLTEGVCSTLRDLAAAKGEDELANLRNAVKGESWSASGASSRAAYLQGRIGVDAGWPS